MTMLCRCLPLFGLALSGLMVAAHGADALTIPTPTTVDLGPFGAAQISGGVDGIGRNRHRRESWASMTSVMRRAASSSAAR